MNETTLPRIYTSPLQSPETVEIIADMDMLESKLENMPNVETEEQAEVVSEYRAQFRSKAKMLDKNRLEMTAGARQTVSMLNDAFKPIIERTERCVQLADNKLLPYMQERERIRREEERKAAELKAEEDRKARVLKEKQEEADLIAANTKDAAALTKANKSVEEARSGLDALHRTPVTAPVKKSVTGMLGSGTALRQNWKYRISDFSKIPDEYLVPEVERLNKGVLNKMAKSDQENLRIVVHVGIIQIFTDFRFCFQIIKGIVGACFYSHSLPPIPLCLAVLLF